MEGPSPGRRGARCELFLDRPVAPTFRFEGFARLGDPNTVLSIVASSPEGGAFNGFSLRPARVKGGEAGREFQPFDEARNGRIQTPQRDPGDGSARVTTSWAGPEGAGGAGRRAVVPLRATHDSPGS